MIPRQLFSPGNFFHFESERAHKKINGRSLHIFYVRINKIGYCLQAAENITVSRAYP
jgi:hypothetical protein